MSFESPAHKRRKSLAHFASSSAELAGKGYFGIFDVFTEEKANQPEILVDIVKRWIDRKKIRSEKRKA